MGGVVEIVGVGGRGKTVLQDIDPLVQFSNVWCGKYEILSSSSPQMKCETVVVIGKEICMFSQFNRKTRTDLRDVFHRQTVAIDGTRRGFPFQCSEMLVTAVGRTVGVQRDVDGGAC